MVQETARRLCLVKLDSSFDTIDNSRIMFTEENEMKLRWCSFLLAVMFFGGAAGAQLTTIFTETWTGENVGDNANQLVQWAHEPAYGNGADADAVIINAGSGGFARVLSMNPPNGSGDSAAMGIRTKNSYGTPAPQKTIAIKSGIALNAADGGGAGTIGIAQADAGGALWGYGLAVSRHAVTGGFESVVEIFEFRGSLTGNGHGYQYVSDADPTDPTGNMYELRAELTGTAANLSVYVNDALITALSEVDTTPIDLSGMVTFSLASNLGQHAFFENVEAAEHVVPEPCCLALLAVAGILKLRRRRPTS